MESEKNMVKTLLDYLKEEPPGLEIPEDMSGLLLAEEEKNKVLGLIRLKSLSFVLYKVLVGEYEELNELFVSGVEKIKEKDGEAFLFLFKKSPDIHSLAINTHGVVVDSVAGLHAGEKLLDVKSLLGGYEDSVPILLSFMVNDNSGLGPERIDYDKFSVDEFAQKVIEDWKLVYVVNSFYRYESGIYKPLVPNKNSPSTPESDGMLLVKAQIARLAPSLSEKKISDIAKRVQIKAYKLVTSSSDDEYVINIKNGRYNLKTHELMPHSEDIIEFYQLPIIYNENASSKDFDEYRNQTFDGDIDLIKVLDELAGYCFWKSLPAQKFFFFWGKPGTGKSTYLDMMEALLGTENVSNVSLRMIERDMFSTSSMVDKLANFSDEANAERVMDSVDTIKQLATGGKIRTQKKFQNAVDVRIYATQIFCINDPFSFNDEALADRLMVIPFWNKYRNTDKNIDSNSFAAKFHKPEIISYMFKLAMDGLKRLQGNGFQFTESATIKEATEQFIGASNPVKQWLVDDEITADNISEFSAEEVVGKYETWIKLNRLNIPIRKNKVKQAIRELLGVEKKVYKGKNRFVKVL